MYFIDFFMDHDVTPRRAWNGYLHKQACTNVLFSNPTRKFNGTLAGRASVVSAILAASV